MNNSTAFAFDTALVSFIAGCQKLIDDENLMTRNVLRSKPGRRYVKLVRCDTHGNDESVFCFVEKETGNVLKPASWAAPAKGSRGNIFDDHNGLRRMSWTGPAYNR